MISNRIDTNMSRTSKKDKFIDPAVLAKNYLIDDGENGFLPELVTSTLNSKSTLTNI